MRGRTKRHFLVHTQSITQLQLQHHRHLRMVKCRDCDDRRGAVGLYADYPMAV